MSQGIRTDILHFSSVRFHKLPHGGDLPDRAQRHAFFVTGSDNVSLEMPAAEEARTGMKCALSPLLFYISFHIERSKGEGGRV